VKPLAHAAFAKPSAAPLLLGYSGGGDSTALLLEMTATGRPVIAAIVDHGLREGSAADAARAAAIAREAGADAEILTLSWPSGPKRAQAPARRGRMNALAAFARRAGAESVALAHTRDDQAETVLLRLAAGSTWFGLAGMAARAPFPLWPEGRGLWLNRPLLGERRAALRERLINTGASWIEDPANSQTAYARVRARARLAGWEEGLGVERWAGLADRLSPAAGALDAAVRAGIETSVQWDCGWAVLDFSSIAALPEEVQRRALGAVLGAAGGAERVPEDAALDRILATPDKARTLGGAMIRPSNGKLRIGRDPGAVLGRAGTSALAELPLPAGQTVIWDGRLALTAAEPGWRARPAGDGQTPALQHGKAVETLANALEMGAVRAEWLLSERIAHLLWR
jgi:tRNA(Ile)-lysidine synthase